MTPAFTRQSHRPDSLTDRTASQTRQSHRPDSLTDQTASQTRQPHRPDTFTDQTASQIGQPHRPDTFTDQTASQTGQPHRPDSLTDQTVSQTRQTCTESSDTLTGVKLLPRASLLARSLECDSTESSHGDDAVGGVLTKAFEEPTGQDCNMTTISCTEMSSHNSPMQRFTVNTGISHYNNVLGRV